LRLEHFAVRRVGQRDETGPSGILQTWHASFGFTGSLLVQEMKTKRAAGSNGVEEGLDFSWWGRG
jgi:hypothetical protein